MAAEVIARCVLNADDLLEAITCAFDLVTEYVTPPAGNRLDPVPVCRALIARMDVNDEGISDTTSGDFGWIYVGCMLVIANSTCDAGEFQRRVNVMRAKTIKRSDGSPGIVKVIAMLSSVFIDGCGVTAMEREHDLMQTLELVMNNVIVREQRVRG